MKVEGTVFWWRREADELICLALVHLASNSVNRLHDCIIEINWIKDHTRTPYTHMSIHVHMLPIT